MSRTKRYGITHFVFDLVMIVLTGGLWFLWMLFRFLRSN